MQSYGTLYFFCGKMAAGKSTLAKRIAIKEAAILISEDEWLTAFYPTEIKSFQDYLVFSLRLKPILFAHVRQLLQSGISVVMDFPANTLAQREWFEMLLSSQEQFDSALTNKLIPHKLLYLKATDQKCLKQLQKRRIEEPKRNLFDTEKVFNQVTHYFEAPTSVEPFNIQIIEV